MAASAATTVSSVTKKEYGYLMGYTLQRVECLEDLNPGDHIAFPRGMAYKDPTFWHHAIVEDIDKETDGIVVIHYYNTSPKSLDASLALIEAFARIKRETLPMYNDIVYRVCYDDPKECLNAEEVLERARSKLGEGNYNVWTNNCEHFATWCKTGKKRCGQVLPAKLLLGAVVSTSSVKGACTGLAEVVTQSNIMTAVKGTYNAGTKIAGSAARAAIDAIGLAAILATLLSSFLEIVFTAIECMEAKKRLTQGKINQREFDDIVGKRVAEGVGDIAGGVGGLIGGAATGALLGPIGAVAGGIVGGMAGGVGGRLTGWGMGKAGVAIRDHLEWKSYAKINVVGAKSDAQADDTLAKSMPEGDTQEWALNSEVEEVDKDHTNDFEFFHHGYHIQVQSLLCYCILLCLFIPFLFVMFTLSLSS